VVVAVDQVLELILMVVVAPAGFLVPAVGHYQLEYILSQLVVVVLLVVAELLLLLEL
jgi:hypothetical protein